MIDVGFLILENRKQSLWMLKYLQHDTLNAYLAPTISSLSALGAM